MIPRMLDVGPKQNRDVTATSYQKIRMTVSGRAPSMVDAKGTHAITGGGSRTRDVDMPFTYFCKAGLWQNLHYEIRVWRAGRRRRTGRRLPLLHAFTWAVVAILAIASSNTEDDISKLGGSGRGA